MTTRSLYQDVIREGACRAIGSKAFVAGSRCVPLLDPTMMKFMESVVATARKNDVEAPSLLPMLESWHSGWAAENLKPDAVWVEVTP